MSSNETQFPLIPVDYSPDWNFKDHAATFGVEMSLIHNVFIRCLNSIYHNALLVKKGDEHAFTGYVLAWTQLIHYHHHGEETIVFPFLQTKFDMKHNIEQHATFNSGLNVFEEYVKNVFDRKESYDGERVCSLIEVFGDTLITHLHEEIPTISPERLVQYDTKELKAMVNKHTDHIKTMQLTTTHVLVYTHHDFKQVPTWPEMPGPAEFFVKNVAYWRYHKYWQFSPFTRSQQPQNYIA